MDVSHRFRVPLMCHRSMESVPVGHLKYFWTFFKKIVTVRGGGGAVDLYLGLAESIDEFFRFACKFQK